MRVFVCILVALISPVIVGAQETYFPPHSFSPIQRLDNSEANQTVWMLHLLGETSLLTKSKLPGIEVYRFLWLPSFKHPVSVRMEVRTDGTALITTTVAPGSAGFPYTCKGPVQTVTKTLTLEQIQTFRALVQSVAFWSIPSSMKNDQTGTDGSVWIIEAVKDGHYHMVNRCSPVDSREPSKEVVRKLGMALALDLGQLPMEKDDIY